MMLWKERKCEQTNERTKKIDVFKALFLFFLSNVDFIHWSNVTSLHINVYFDDNNVSMRSTCFYSKVSY